MAERPGPLVLIGPPGAGKTSVADEMSKRTCGARIEIDAGWVAQLRRQPAIAAVEPVALVGPDGDVLPSLRRAYLMAVRERLTSAHGEATAARALEQAKARAAIDMVERAGDDAIVDFGAGHSIYEHLDLRAAVRAALSRALVVLLLPCAEPAAAVAILAGRLAAQGRPVSAARLAEYVEHPSNRALADATLHTGTCTIAEVAAQLVALAAELRASGRTGPCGRSG
ncbi:AAA family ATPase [Nannocystis pusilla]|uniref:AAA family ATPase n=1 Tax=Nannocystis pusilla TaxID=889268 RepID=A0ABS7U649_9BACT|nr:AAA family ATPase [Nannocystis pusilla]MBZ5715955.1 AAA family ATPase [Nannocystis pusilla]